MKGIAKLALKVVVPMIFIFACLELLMFVLDPYLFTNRFESQKSAVTVLRLHPAGRLGGASALDAHFNAGYS